MVKNKKLIFITSTFTCCLCITSMASNYVFTKSASVSTSGTVDIKDRTFGLTDIILKAGYNDTSCSVRDSNGNDVSLEDITNFFIENKDVEDKYGNHFVQLKRYYLNISLDPNDEEGVITYKISNTKVNETYFVCPYFYNKDGDEIPYAYYGKYKGSVTNEVLYSISGAKPTYSKTINNFRTYARANGEQYHQTDWCAVFTAQIMCMCAYKTTQTVDILTSYRSLNQETGTGTEILGIEDIIGNGFECVDGVVFRSGSTLAASTVSYATKISDYAAGITSNQTTLTGATGSNGGYITKMYYSEGQPALSIFPKELIANYTDKYYCDRFYYKSSTSPNLTFWGARYDGDNYGLFYLNCENAYTKTYAYLTCRLHAKIIETSS